MLVIWSIGRLMLLPAGNSSVDVANFDYVGLELNISFATASLRKLAEH